MTTLEFKQELATAKSELIQPLTDLATMAINLTKAGGSASAKQINYLAHKLAYEIVRDGGLTEELLEDAALDAGGLNFTVLTKIKASEAIDLLS